MGRAVEESFRNGSQAAVLIGADCPELSAGLVSEAFEALRHRPVVFGPALDGGYYLVGLGRAVPELFEGPAWGTGTVLADSLRILQRIGLEPALLKPLTDIDRPQDLDTWSRITSAEEQDLSQISIVIPTFNEASCIARTVAAATSGDSLEVIVVDGGSTDETAHLARQAGARVVGSRAGRGRQMNAGASAANGNVLLFLHADTLLPPDYSSLMATCLSDSSVSAGAFSFALAERFTGRSVVEWSANLRSRWLQRPYGDQGLFLRRTLFEELGGFVDWPILEDYEFVRRLRRYGRVRTLAKPAMTSGRRWQKLGLLRTTWINKRVIMGYRLGLPVDRLAEIYRGQSKDPSGRTGAKGGKG
jgi:rSAM/selenodomain-associated transferase 2